MIPAKEIDGELWIRAADARIQKEAEQRDLRDYFAAKAMQGLISGTSMWSHDEDDSGIALCAYAIADAMLKARKK